MLFALRLPSQVDIVSCTGGKVIERKQRFDCKMWEIKPFICYERARKDTQSDQGVKVIYDDYYSSLNIYNPDRISPDCWHTGNASSCPLNIGSETVSASASWQETISAGGQEHHESVAQVLSEEFQNPLLFDLKIIMSRQLKMIIIEFAF